MPALRCIYADLDGTMLGRGASLLRDAEGNFSALAVRALEAAHRAGAEVVITSGRRKAQVLEDARIIGQRSYIYEMGCGVADGDEEVFICPGFDAGGEVSVHDQIERSGAPGLLRESFPGRLEPHSPWHTDRQFSVLLRGNVDLAEAERLLAERGHDGVRLIDNGITSRRSPGLDVDPVRTYHLVPRAAGKGAGVALHMRRRGIGPAQCIAVGDARGDLEVAGAVGRFFLVANGLDRDPAVREEIGGLGNVTVTEEPMTAGFYEAVVRALAEARAAV